MRQAHPADQLELWGSDEQRVGLKPIVRWVWARRGQRVVVPVRPRYQWCYVYGFVRPRTGQTWWRLRPTVRADRFGLALAQFAQAVGAGPGKPVLVLLDRAGWHLSTQVQVPAGLQLVWLPAYSPELQPAERLWPLVDEPLANQTFATLDDLEAVLAQRCTTLQHQSARIQARTLFHWWPKTA